MRAIVIVLDGCGAGAAPDSAEFGATEPTSTVRHVWEAVGGFHAPNLASVGFLAACGIGPAPEPLPGRPVSYGRLQPLSKGGKDSVVGHWEMMGIELDRPFPTFPNGFPAELVSAFSAAIGRDVLGNRAASGTQIISELGGQHLRSGAPILYTSADSVLQIAAHEEVVPVETLYAWCEAARALCVGDFEVQRVIARPFTGEEGHFQRTERRRDYPLTPPTNLIDEIGDVYGIGVVPELFGGRGFRDVPRTQSNAEHAEVLWRALESDARFIFANFEDFDMRYGHRNDAAGFARCLEAFDHTLGELLARTSADDLIVLTADHGNDPTTASTDHDREYVPCVAIGSAVPFSGDIAGFSHVGRLVSSAIVPTITE
ncbi:MAG: phosphopentomutase [Fimbriimonadaceae bacterium]|nr:phosphopentomutase [Fimbriimonadaceae bacterium]